MATRLSTGLVNGLMATDSFKGLFNNVSAGASAGCYINIYSGSQPLSADDAATGTLLCTVSVSAGSTGMTFETTAGSPNAGQLEKTAAETWSGTAVATGTAGWFRLYRKADAPAGASTSLIRMDGNISTAGADMNLGSLSVVNGAPFILTAFDATLPQT